MKPKDFANQLRHDEIVAAIRAAEQKTSGEVRVFISQKPTASPVETAQAEFVRMGMEKTRERNGVLIFVAPLTHQFAVIGDAGIHAKCGKQFWEQLASSMQSHFSKADFTQGIIDAINQAGNLLAQHFPRRSDDRNELSDEIERD